jgi:hypothetical protein
MPDRESDEQLLRRLRRIVVAARAIGPGGDRRRVLALESDLRLVRAALNRRCGMLVDKMNEAGAQLRAVSAYARCASLRRDPAQPSK